MNYFDLIKTHKDNSSIRREIILFETSNDFRLPLMYRTLITIYDLSIIGTKKVLFFYHSQYDAKLQFYSVTNKMDENISIEQWYNLDEIIEKTNSIYQGDPSIKNKYVAIGESFDQCILLLGVTSDNSDKIFLEQAYSDPRIKEINSNIFDFLYDFEILPKESDLPSGTKISDLYKNWGEDFWRIREDEKPA